MTRLTSAQYDRRVFVAMIVYVVLLLALLPQARGSGDWSLRAICSLVPTLPMLYVIWLFARRILSSDELEQRTHLIALGVACAVIAVFSLIGGFLAATKVVPGETAATLLLWTFPILMLSYGLARLWAVRRYGGGLCDEPGAMSMQRRLMLLALLFALVAAWTWYHSGDAMAVGVFCGFTAGLVFVAVIFAARRWRQRNAGDE